MTDGLTKKTDKLLTNCCSSVGRKKVEADESCGKDENLLLVVPNDAVNS